MIASENKLSGVSLLVSCLAILSSSLAAAAQQPQPSPDEQTPPSINLPDTNTTPRLVVKLGHSGTVSFTVLSNDGTRMLSASSDEVILWDVATGAELRRFVGHTKELSSIAFSRDKLSIVTSSWDKTVRLWEAATGKELRRITGPKGDSQNAIFSPDGKYILTRIRRA